MFVITFDNFGCAHKTVHGQGKLPPEMRPASIPESEWENWMEIGLNLGQPRILKLLKELEINTTFYAEGYAAVLHPVEMRRWVDDGHEIALHAWKHELWAGIGSREKEEALLSKSMEAMRQVIGDAMPVGFRPPGFKINPWTEELLEQNDIRYISRVAERDQAFADRFKSIGITYADAGDDVPIKRLKVQPVDDYLTDAFLVPVEHGGLFGETADDEAGYELAYESAVRHHAKTPDEPWVFVAHPMISGNRAWFGFAGFLRRLHAEFGSGAFMTARQAILGN